MALDYEKLKKERITGTKIAPYHMITAVTQRSINHQLAKMWKVNITWQTLTIKSADPGDDWSELRASLKAPTIELRLGTENRIVTFCLNIERATLKYLKFKGRPYAADVLEIPSCVLALSVDLTFEGVDFKMLPQEVQDCLKVENNYRVQQLLIDFTSAGLARLDTQRTTVQHHIKDTVAKASFDVFIQLYLEKLGKNKNDFVLHYLPLATTEGRKAYAMPTVPPTDFTFVNIPFVVSATDNGKPSDNNMLVYLQMTENEAMPRELLSTSANWVVPSPHNMGRYDGTVALSRKIFVAGWLLPKLTEFNKQSSYVVTDVRLEGGTLSWKYHLHGHLGRENATKEELIFTPLDAANDVVNPLPPGHRYHYEFSSSKKVGSPIQFVTMSSKTENYLFIPEGYNKDGKCEILLYGSTKIDFHVFASLVEPNSFGWVQGKWSTSIILDGINDGELIVKISDIDVKITEDIHQAARDTTRITDFTDPVKEGLKALSITYLLAQLRDVLTGGWQFVFPERGDFYISKAVFNREEDLLCELKYKFKA